MPELKLSGRDWGCEKRGIWGLDVTDRKRVRGLCCGRMRHIPSLDGKGHLDFDGGDRTLGEAALPIGSGRSVLNLGVRIFFLESGYLRISDYNFAAEGQNRDESQPISRGKAWSGVWASRYGL
jgi:hypothetical protein